MALFAPYGCSWKEQAYLEMAGSALEKGAGKLI